VMIEGLRNRETAVEKPAQKAVARGNGTAKSATARRQPVPDGATEQR
jgi:hypothetical protein